MSYSRCLSHKDDGNRQKGCIVDKLVKFMGICYLNNLPSMALSIFKFEPVKLILKSWSKINSMLLGNADNKVSKS